MAAALGGFNPRFCSQQNHARACRWLSTQWRYRSHPLSSAAILPPPTKLSKIEEDYNAIFIFLLNSTCRSHRSVLLAASRSFRRVLPKRLFVQSVRSPHGVQLAAKINAVFSWICGDRTAACHSAASFSISFISFFHSVCLIQSS